MTINEFGSDSKETKEAEATLVHYRGLVKTVLIVIQTFEFSC
jgi:hypothetical protein